MRGGRDLLRVYETEDGTRLVDLYRDNATATFALVGEPSINMSRDYVDSWVKPFRRIYLSPEYAVEFHMVDYVPPPPPPKPKRSWAKRMGLRKPQ